MTETTTMGVYNMSNVTVEPEPEAADPNQLLYDFLANFTSSMFVITGLMMFVGNLLLFYPIAYHKAFRTRKEYIVIAGLAMADALNGLAFAVAGLYRIPRGAMYGSSSNTLELTSFGCALLPFNILWGLFYPTAALMLCVTSLDRLLVTAFTMWYISKGPMLSYVLVGTVYLHGFIYESAAMISGYLMRDEGPVGTDMCWQSLSMNGDLYSYELQVFSRGHIGSILIFVGAIIMYAIHNKKAAHGGEINAQAAKQQKEMTIKMAWSTLATLFMVIIPTEVADYIWADYPSQVVGLLYIPPNFNPLINVYLFLIKHKLMRKALKKALSGKKMPVNLKDWAEKTTMVTKTIEVQPKK